LFALGPAGWHRYFRDSRILERVGSRLKMRFQQKRKRTRIASVTWSKEAGAAGRLRS